MGLDPINPSNEYVSYPLSERQKDWLDRWYYHSDVKDPDRFKTINDATRKLAQLIMQLTPECAEQTIALRDLEMVRMRANQAIVMERYYQEERKDET